MDAEFVINILKEKITAIETALLIYREISPGAKFNHKLGRIFFFRFIHFADLFFSPGFSICYAIIFTDMFFGTKRLAMPQKIKAWNSKPADQET